MRYEIIYVSLCAACTENFENKNYTILTARCKGPQYPPVVCCNALKDFACPFADAINDLTTDCASTMFSYINLYGKYPPGLFSNLCREGKLGLNCTDVGPDPDDISYGVHTTVTHSTLLIITAGFIVFLLFHWFWRMKFMRIYSHSLLFIGLFIHSLS